jgi:hypothetical protein
LALEYRIYADSVNAGNLADMITAMRRWEEKYFIREGRRPSAPAVMKPSKVSVKAVSSDEPTRHKSTKSCYRFQKDECWFGDRCIFAYIKSTEKPSEKVVTTKKVTDASAEKPVSQEPQSRRSLVRTAH